MARTDLELPRPRADTEAVEQVDHGARRPDPFRTDHLMSDLKGRSIRGSAQTIAAQGLKFTIQLGSTMVLARVLTPGDFGLVAMATIVMGFVVMFKDAGLSMATIQSPSVSHDQVSAMFWVNVLIGGVLAVVVAASAPLLAYLYNEPRLVPITVALAATLLVGGATVQHQALLRRQMRFGTLVMIDLAAMACGVGAAVAIAVWTRSYWALVANPIITTVVAAAVSVAVSGWRPGRPARSAGVGSMLRFGGNLTLASFLTHATQSVDKLLLGYVQGATALGVYRAAYELVMLPLKLQQGPVASVMLPSLSRLQVDPPKFRSAYLRVISILALGGGPVAAILFIEAALLVRLVLGPQWGDSAPVLRAFIPAALVITLYSAPRYLMIATGRARLYMRTAAIELAIVGALAIMVIIAGASAVWVASVVSIGTVMAFLVSVVLSTRGTAVSLRDIAAHLVPHVVAAGLSIGMGEMVRNANPASGMPGIALSVLIVVLMYIGSVMLFPKGRWSLELAHHSIHSAIKHRHTSHVQTH